MNATDSADARPTGDGGWHLRLTNDPGDLPLLHGWIDELSLALGLGPEVTFAADLCLQEAVSNVIAHAFPDNASHEIGVSASLIGRDLILEVEDDGSPFDPLAVPPPEAVDRLEDVRIGGLGIHLIRRFASRMRYAREGERNRLTMVIDSHGKGA